MYYNSINENKFINDEKWTIKMANSNLVQSLLKGLDILNVVGNSDNGLTLGDISEQLDMKKPAAHNLLRTLCARGFLEKNGGGRYRLGKAFRRLAERDGEMSFQQHISEALKALIGEFPEAIVNYTELVGADLMPLQRIVPERPNMIQSRSGITYHLYYSPSGFLHFAFCDKAVLEHVERNHPFSNYQSFRTRGEFDAKVAEAKKLGYSFMDDKDGLKIAAPVFVDKKFRGCIGTFFPPPVKCSKSIEEIVASLLKYAKLLST